MKAIAVDDEPLALEVVRAHAEKVSFIELAATFTHPFQAMEYLQKEPVDLIFLDIKMPDITGIEFYQSLNKKPLVIFTTAYSEHAVTSFEMDAVDYLLKPFSLVRFVKACNKAYELYQARNILPAADHFFLKTGYEQVKVVYEDILYLEATGNYVNFILKDKKLLSRLSISEASGLLPQKNFMRIHRSYIVALNKIDKVERGQLWIGNQVLPVSEAYSNEVMTALKR